MQHQLEVAQRVPYKTWMPDHNQVDHEAQKAEDADGGVVDHRTAGKEVDSFEAVLDAAAEEEGEGVEGHEGVTVEVAAAARGDDRGIVALKDVQDLGVEKEDHALKKETAEEKPHNHDPAVPSTFLSIYQSNEFFNIRSRIRLDTYSRILSSDFVRAFTVPLKKEVESAQWRINRARFRRSEAEIWRVFLRAYAFPTSVFSSGQFLPVACRRNPSHGYSFQTYYGIKKHSNSNLVIKGIPAPEPPGALSLIGHLHLLNAQAPIAHILASLAHKYGPIFTIRLGVRRCLVVSTQEAIKECFTTNDKILAARPTSSHGVHFSYNFAGFGFAPDGPYWRKLRKLVMLELLSPRRVEPFKHVHESEISTFVKDLYLYLGDNASGTVVVIDEWLERLTFNILTKMIAGKRYFGNLQDVNDEEAHWVVKLIKDFMHMSGESVPSDWIPFLGWFRYEGRVLKSMKRIARDLDELVTSWVEEHDVKICENGVSDYDHKQDFIDFMLSVIEEDDDTLGHSRDTIIKANVLNLILAGADTTSINMTWMLSLLLNNKHALKRAQEEIDVHVGKQRWVQTSDIKNLTYLKAIAKETLRLYPPAPHLVPHEATQDCTISGYLVPKGTIVIANAWKLHRDPSIWSQPESFEPERFISSSNNNNNSNSFEYLSFGYGRRACPGSALAMQVSLLTMARLLQGFEIEEGEGREVDMREGMGLTMPKATPLQVLLTPRLSHQYYHQMLQH
ncbi:cytochrome P450 82C4-like [Senna tora]|uniref:Cytochrome P450 82C4-like n=1 Tax=Senna tora TaxID=362788 RepID=A0A834TNH9_9FABA|nr:cytochrome P450 82C4-like [Senna tora]